MENVKTNMRGTIYNGKEVNFDEIIGETKYHHSALSRGYISRKLECVIEDYKGKFGVGFKVSYPNYRSSQYKIVQYYVKEK